MTVSTGKDIDLSIQECRQRIEFLSGLMTPERFSTLSGVLSSRTRYMTVCTENMFHPQNASALVRHCDAFGLQDIHTIEEVATFRPNVNIVRGTDRWVDLHRHRSTEGALETMKKAGYRIVATTPHSGDSTPEHFDVSAGPFALVFGTEHAGVSEKIVSKADEFLKIPMYGFVESLNVSACAAIMIYMLSEKIRSSGVNWSLPEEDSVRILYRWMKTSVRGSDKILAREFPLQK